MGWVVNATPRRLYPRKYPVPVVMEAGWISGLVCTGAENFAPTGIRSPDRPARSQSLYRLNHPGSVTRVTFAKIVVPLHYHKISYKHLQFMKHRMSSISITNVQAATLRTAQKCRKFRAVFFILKYEGIPSSGRHFCRDYWNRNGSAGIATALRALGSGDRIPVGGEIFRTCPDRSWGPPSLLYNGYRLFPGGKAAGAWH